jgi:RHS repeat-associated protein
MSYPYGALCSPGYATLTAQYYGYDYGEFRWYSSDTDPYPLQTNYIDPYNTTGSYSLYANSGTTMWVSFYSYNSGCESYRQPYTFYIAPPVYVYQDYATKCNYNDAKVQISSNATGVTFQLYKYVEYYDYNYGWVQEYQLQQSNTTGYFEIYDFDPLVDQDKYYVRAYQPYGCSTPYYYPLYFEIVGPNAPTITGNLSIQQGQSTTLMANGNAYNFNWYDAGGNVFNQGWYYTTPTTLTPSNYAYQVRGTSSDGTCLTDPAYVTVTISYPAITYSTPYNSSNFTKTIDLSKPVGIVTASAGASPAGGASYSMPIYAPPGTNSIKPSVSILYNSQSGNGNVGFGWTISGLSSVTRIGKNMYHNGIVSPVAYTNDDGFSLNGVRLNAISGTNGANGTVYATEMEGYSKITSFGANANNPDWFQIMAKDGTIMEFGHTGDSRLLTDDGQNVMLWRLCKIIDVNGNYIEFKYDNGFRDSRIDEINYTGNANTGLQPYNKLKFNYQTRDDRSTMYESGSSLVSRHLLKSIVVSSEGSTVKTYDFNYGFDNVFSLLKEVIESGSDGSSLNSTIFLYGDQVQNFTTQTTVALTGSYDFFAGDFDADGKSDLLAAQTYFDNNTNTRLHYNYSLMKDVNVSSYTLMYYKTLPQNVGSQVLQDKKYFNFLTADYDGDGRDDVLELYSSSENLHCNGYRRVISGGSINYTRSFNNQTGYTDYTQQSFSYPTDWLGYSYQYASQKGNYFIPGDFDGDGNKDYLMILAKKRQTSTCFPYLYYTFDYKAFLSSPSTNEMNREVANFGFGSNSLGDWYAGTVADADFVYTLDFDGDGKTELLVTKDYQTYIIKVQRVSATTGFSFAASVVYSTYEINKDSKVYFGDFNSDRKTDILVRNSSGSWKILYGTGTAFTTVPFGFNQAPAVTGTGTDKVIVADFNGDGYSDILHAYAYFVNGVSNSSRFSLYYYKGANSSSPFYYEQYVYNNILAYGDLTVGDFNGDGRSDLLNRYNVNSPADFISFKPNGRERLLAKVTDGHNATVEFQYKNLTDKSTWPYFYDRTVSLDDPANKNPFNYGEFPLYAVSAMITPNGNGGTTTTTYSYQDLILHRAAKGLLGFKKITAKNLAAGTTTVMQNDLNTQFAILYNYKQVTSLTSTGELLSETNVSNTFTNLSTSYLDKRSFQKIDKILNIDYLSGTASEASNTYDNYGNIATKVVKVGTPSGSTVSAIETTTTTTSFGTYNTPFPARPDQLTVVSARNGASSQSATTQFTYTPAGLVLTQIDFYGLPKAVTTTFGYDGLGNPGSVTIGASGVNNRVTNITYDSKGRFIVTKTLAAGTAIAQTEQYTYDGKWGEPLTATTSDCITTQFEYDGFGRTKKSTDPIFVINYSMGWDVAGNNVYYKLTDYSAGRADAKIWFDKLGRETKRQVAGFNNQWLTSLTTYDARGNIASATNPCYSAETPVTTSKTYDTYNRLQSVSNAINTINYTYNQLGGGNLQIVTSDVAAQTTTKTTDAAGRMISSNDKGGDMYFTYDSRGGQIEVKHGGTTLITNTFDSYGRRTSMVDKNAGTITYAYDAFGQLSQQTDNMNHSYQISYDELGRITSQQGQEGTTMYEYYKDNGTGCSNNNVQKVTGFNGIVKENTYDNLKRLQTEKITVDGTAYITQYNYDSYNNINKITYPSGIEVNKTYDNNGLLTQVTGGSAGAQTTLFNGSQMNGFGQYTSYTLGNNKTSQITYQYGYPTQYYAPGVQNLSFTWDYARNNLTSRQDALKGLTESFAYDPLNRITQSSVNGQVQQTLTYDGNGNFSMGNVATKTDAGTYKYKDDKIHAVAYITDPAGTSAISNSTIGQTISYTPFLKAATISENPYQVSFTYGPDYQRVKSELLINSVISETKIYVGDYEKQTDNTGTKEIHYINGGNGLCAIIVKQNGVNNFYVAYTDYLGSILTLTDLNGNVVTEQNFDAWGRKRSPQNWAYNSVPAVPAWLYRGYTGHEHLALFALINMNGRIYDPIQARMLSPDNYIAGACACNTQGYNRYAYGNNNPLSYVDRDGNNPLLIIAIAAAIFATGNTVAHAINGDIHNFWDGLKYFGEGALAGAAIGTGIAFGLQVPVLGTIIKVAGWTIAGATVLSVVSGGIQSIATGDITPLANAGKIFTGLFNLDENQGFFGAVFQGVSRFSWEMIQTTVGYTFAQVRNTFGGVDDVEFFGGATLVNRNTPDGREGGMTLGNFILGTNLQASINNLTFMHEYGHTIQSRIFGVLYPFIGIVSGIDCKYNCNDIIAIRGGFRISQHNVRWYEMQASRYGARYFSKHFGVIWDDNANPRQWP